MRPRCVCLLLLLLVVLGTTRSVSAADCDKFHDPVAGNETTWFCYRDSDTVFVFIHGILSNNVDSWKNTTKNVLWPQLVREDEANFGQPAIFLAGYPTSVFSGEYDIDSAAQAVLSAMRTKIEGREKRIIDFNKIVFVAHSLGGIVARRLVLMDIDNFQTKRLAFVLVASPSLGTDFTYYFELLGRIVKVENKLEKQLVWKNQYVDALDSQFREFIGANKNTVTGVEFFEDLPLGQSPGIDGLKTFLGGILIDKVILGKDVFSRPVVSKEESWGKYWEKKDAIIPGTDHWTIAKPASIGSFSHRSLADFYLSFARPLFESDAAKCPPLDGINLNILLRKYQKKKWPIVSFRRIATDLDEQKGITEFDPEVPQASKGAFRHFIAAAIPCPGEELRAELACTGWQGQTNSTAITEDDVDALKQYEVSMCFRRSLDLDKNGATVNFDCRDPISGKCSLGELKENALAEPCELQGSLGTLEKRFVRSATFNQAMDAEQKASETLFWVTPSLETIVQQPSKERISYTEFFVVVDNLPEAVRLADRYSVEISVNGHPLWFDGIDPNKIRRRFSQRTGVTFQFGLDPLNFNGAYFGYEQIEARFKFYAGGELVHTAYSRRPYAAYRNYVDSFNSLMKRLTYDDGGFFAWQGLFRPGQSGRDRYAVMLQSIPDKGDLPDASRRMELARDALEGLNLVFEGKPVEGRIYPRRQDLNAIGLTVALKLESGRTEGVFSLARAKDICRFLLRNKKTLIKRGAMAADVFIYDYDPAYFTVAEDRGRAFASCRSIGK